MAPVTGRRSAEVEVNATKGDARRPLARRPPVRQIGNHPNHPLMHQLRKPYLLYLGGAKEKTFAKTAFGLRDWCGGDVIGEWSLATATMSTGVPRLSPAEAGAKGAGSIVIGIASVGGVLPPEWVPDLLAAIEAGLDVVSGMHTRLTSFPALVAAAERKGVRLLDVRHSDRTFPAGSGRKRTGKRAATVGTDCALGKKYTALAIARALKARGVKATFRATGQTGVMIAGEGVAIDAIVADFVAGAAEQLSPDNAPDHWDVIEGQGALFHPAYAGGDAWLAARLAARRADPLPRPLAPEHRGFPGLPDSRPARGDHALRRSGAAHKPEGEGGRGERQLVVDG